MDYAGNVSGETVLPVPEEKKEQPGIFDTGYGLISEDGTQTWVRVRNGVIDNAGVNDEPRTWDSETGLYNNTKK